MSGEGHGERRRHKHRSHTNGTSANVNVAVPVEDLTEVRHQLDVIKKAATKTLQEKEEELRRLEIEHEELKRMLAQQAGRSSVSVQDRNTRVSNLNQRLVAVKTELEGMEDTRGRLRHSLENALAEKRALEKQLRDVREQSAVREKELVESTAEAGRLEQRLHELEAEVANPLPGHGDSEAVRNMQHNLNAARGEQDQIRTSLRDAKYEADQKRAQLEILHNKLRAGADVLGRRDVELRQAQARTQAQVEHALSAYQGNSSDGRFRDAHGVVQSKEEQIEILTAKAREADRLMDDLLEFVKSAAITRTHHFEDAPAPPAVSSVYSPSVAAHSPARPPVTVVSSPARPHEAHAASHIYSPGMTSLGRHEHSQLYRAAPAPAVSAAPARSAAPEFNHKADRLASDLADLRTSLRAQGAPGGRPLSVAPVSAPVYAPGPPVSYGAPAMRVPRPYQPALPPQGVYMSPRAPAPRAW